MKTLARFFLVGALATLTSTAWAQVTGAVPLFASTAGTPEAEVLAGLPAVQRMTDQNLFFERRLRVDELGKLRHDLDDVRNQLAMGGGQTAQMAGSLRLTLVGSMNRQATIASRVDTIDRELARRRTSR